MAKTRCTKCASCCNDISVEIEKPKKFDDFETIKWMISHENVKVYMDHDGEWLVEFTTKCKNLDEKKRCLAYSERYPVCRDHSPHECIVNGSGNFHKVMLETKEDVDNYMKKIGFFKKYMIEKEKMMKKSNK